MACDTGEEAAHPDTSHQLQAVPHHGDQPQGNLTTPVLSVDVSSEPFVFIPNLGSFKLNELVSSPDLRFHRGSI